MITLDEASALARTAHAGQADLAGNPYHLHVFAVRDLLAPHGEDAQIAGVLHDILEDTPTTADDLRTAGVPEHVVTAIVSVTKRPGEPYPDLIARAAADPIGRLVKLADNAHNSDETRLARLPADQAGALREKYARARAVLAAGTAIGRMGLGLAALGRPAYLNVGRELPAGRGVEAMRAATWEVLDAAYAAGVRWVDAARSYGRSEEFLSGWLADRGRTDVTVSSKWGYTYVGDWRLDADVHEVKEHSARRFHAQLAETRELLGTRAEVYQVHSLTAGSPLFADTALQHDLADLAAEGVRVGFSTSGPAQAETIRRALDLSVGGRALFTTVQSTWNLLEPSAGEALREARDGGAHVLLKEVLANGRLAVDPPAPVRRAAERHGVGPDAIALAAALANPWADTVLSGAVSVAQLTANLAAARVTLDDGERAELAGLATPPARYWERRAAMPWT